MSAAPWRCHKAPHRRQPDRRHHHTALGGEEVDLQRSARSVRGRHGNGETAAGTSERTRFPVLSHCVSLLNHLVKVNSMKVTSEGDSEGSQTPAANVGGLKKSSRYFFSL